MLAQVQGPYNAILVIGDVVGETLYQGPGAGMMPTASVGGRGPDRPGRGPGAEDVHGGEVVVRRAAGSRVEPSEKVRSRFYLRLLVPDQPGVLADVCRLLADQQHQHFAASSSTRPARTAGAGGAAGHR
ncbi:MAG: hypothetical protein QM749_16400 [Aquabacterium sp.]